MLHAQVSFPFFHGHFRSRITASSIITSSYNQHFAELLCSDIQDNSNLRRGAPSAHTVFGVAQTINSAN